MKSGWILASGMGAAALLGVWLLRDVPPSPDASLPSEAENVSPATPRKSPVTLSARPPSGVAPSASDGGRSSAASDFVEEPLSENLKNPVYDRASFFASETPSPDPRLWKVRWHKSCESLPPGSRSSDLRASLKENGVDVAGVYPEGFVQDWNRYFSKDGVYIQLSANWQADSPPTYRIEMFMSDDMKFEKNVTPKGSRFIPRGAVSWAKAREALEGVTGELQQQGYVAGKRTTIVSDASPHDPQAAETSKVEYFGAMPRVYQNDTTFCVPSQGYLCYCSDKPDVDPAE